MKKIGLVAEILNTFSNITQVINDKMENNIKNLPEILLAYLKVSSLTVAVGVL